ncbi:hypothetical protein TWF569_005918 [Orbilia oligospora]|uniref:Myb-like domain-containing protein n=1 Tax=Orbilia oligospora TaxID=2813651 RepID=A0A7C8NI54_ORBOL|nr:hypothetical protein TWF102_011339 [Orbilia oligospora]KAF3092187.1 hypothetical protein TWF103_011320 [Orbilia oligospora]KAF3116827.1 hypothetical protein TWF706_000053 [Orbilia oligospora]KAF3130438.1 hypothetical protein TWF703_008235 [Orbilia oligospora]KAF3142160.1 hypothetical protein TWF594_005526 [Orbilia oligospora]
MEYEHLNTASPKGQATGGGKAWSEEEEAYLLQKRSEKVAYKKIALQLSKTELACRLHFHQLQRGSNRRRRNLSMSSSESTGPIYATAGYPTSNYGDINRRSASPGGTPPVPEIRYRERSSFSPGHGRNHSWTSSPSGFGARPLDNPADVDYSRLQRLVDHHKRNMWAAVAADYGEGATPEFLETFWSKQQAARHEYERKPTGTPPTPMVSPRTEAEQIACGRGVSPSVSQHHPLNQHPRKAAREGCRPWELETPILSIPSPEKKRYELFGPELHGSGSGYAHPAAVAAGVAIAEMSRYSPERSMSNRPSSHSSHRSISVESIIAPPEVIMTRV